MPQKNTRMNPISKSPFGRPLRAMFLLTSMPIGGAETLLVNLARRFDPERIEPLIGCMKDKDVLGEQIGSEFPIFENLINHKYDFAVAGRLRKLFKQQNIDALITVGAGDKMFWGRLGARRAQVPVILSALHSTGWPDGVGRLNRMLTGITDGFIACARQHATYQIEQEKFPQDKVFLIPNGIDTDRFVFDPDSRNRWRSELNIAPDAPVVGIVAALRPEKNHSLFLQSAKRVVAQRPDARFIIAGDGPERSQLETQAKTLCLEDNVLFIGSTHDIPGVLSTVDVFALTSHNEASPVSIMEALACGRPVVATDVGSIDESVLENETGFLVTPGSATEMADRWLTLLNDTQMQHRFGEAGREHIVANSSLQSMTDGYTRLIENTYAVKTKTAFRDSGIATTRPDSLATTHLNQISQ
jgi:glycosyltransferase involved in cell wall biosynthesis